jgi:mannobiose 2-epimerase
MINSLNRYIMKRMFSVFLLITVWLLIAPFLKAQSHADKILKYEIISDLKENILSFWEKYSVDPSGGFYGSLGRDGTPIADGP